MPAEPRLHHTVELVDAERHRLDERGRVAHPHQVARLVGRQLGEGRGERGQHLLARLADRQPTDAVAVEADLHGAAGTLRAQRLAHSPLHDAEQRLVGAHVGGTRPVRPGVRPLDGRTDDLGRTRQRRAHVEHHLDVGPEPLLHVDRDLGREPVRRAVVDALERHPVVVDLRVEREHLEPARIGERQAVPPGEAAEAAEPFDEVGARSQHQVVGVAEHDLGADLRVVGGAQVLDRGRACRPA